MTLSRSYIYQKGEERKREMGLWLGRDGFGLRWGTPTDVYLQMGIAQEGAESGNTVERGHTCRSDIREKAGGDPAHAGGGPRREHGQSLPSGRREGRVRGHRGSLAGGWGAALWGRSLDYFHFLSKIESKVIGQEQRRSRSFGDLRGRGVRQLSWRAGETAKLGEQRRIALTNFLVTPAHRV